MEGDEGEKKKKTMRSKGSTGDLSSSDDEITKIYKMLQNKAEELGLTYDELLTYLGYRNKAEDGEYFIAKDIIPTQLRIGATAAPLAEELELGWFLPPLHRSICGKPTSTPSNCNPK